MARKTRSGGFAASISISSLLQWNPCPLLLESKSAEALCHNQCWPESHVCMFDRVHLSGRLPSMQSYTVCIYTIYSYGKP